MQNLSADYSGSEDSEGQVHVHLDTAELLDIPGYNTSDVLGDLELSTRELLDLDTRAESSESDSLNGFPSNDHWNTSSLTFTIPSK